MPNEFEPVLDVCRVCNGDPRASVTCRSCRGAQVGLPTEDGYLVWAAPLDAFSFAFRKTRVMLNAILHLAIGISAAVCVALFLITVARANAWRDLGLSSYWFAGHWEVTALWLGLILFAFFIFRIRVYTERVRPLPHWGETKRGRTAKPAAADQRQAVDISVRFQPAAWSVLEQAFGLAERIGRTEVRPIHVFSAALSSTAGGIFITRLGLNFEKIKEGLLVLVREGQSGSPTLFSLETKELLLRAYQDAQQAHRKAVGIIELFLQAFLATPRLQEVFDAAGYPPEHVKRVAEWIRMQEQLMEEHDRFQMLAQFKPKSAMNRAMTAQQTPLLNQLSEDMTLLAREGYLPSVIGRETEINEILRAIESGRRAVALVGEAGVGKTSIVEALARRMVEEDVPPQLFDRRLVAVHLPQLLGAGDPSLAIDRLLSLLREVGMSGNIILVLHGIEALVGGGTGGPMDLAEAFATELDKGYFTAIATTTPDAWVSYLERRSLGPKFAKVTIREMETEDVIRVLMAKTGSIEYQNNVFFSYAALEKTAQLAGRYLHDIHAPENAIEVAKEAAVLTRKERGENAFVTAEDVARVIHEKTNIPVEAVTTDESAKLLNLEDKLHHRVIGQEEAVTAVAQAIRRARAEVREGKRPIANFLFLGPTGVGKTELAKALAAEYFGNENAMIRLDMSEYQDPASAARVIGAPGDKRGGLLTEAVRQAPFSIVLLDELEKAHPDILTLFLQVMDDGRLTDGVGRTIDFTNVVLIATSNAGTNFIQDAVKAATPIEQIKTALLERELRGIFRPEFLNRFDGVIVFKPLSMDDVVQIAWLMINSISKRLQEKGILFRADDAAVEELAHAGFDPLFGARPLRRVIQDRVENALADIMLKKEVNRRDTIILKPGGKLEVEKASLT